MRLASLRTNSKFLIVGLLLVGALATPPAAQAQIDRSPRRGIQITLDLDFIKKYANRATIDADYTVDKAHKRVNPPDKDGDLHAAGGAPEILLPTVAEIMNAGGEDKAVGLIHDAEKNHTPLAISGAWRIWCEHGGTQPQTQGDEGDRPYNTTNPPHVFEIHPITKINNLSLLRSLKPIDGFKTKDAHDAFVNYENLPWEMKLAAKNKVEIHTQMGGYNYVQFILEVDGALRKLDDNGTSVLAKVRDLEGELLVRERRMIFIDGSEPAKRVATMKPGKRLHVLGIPRIDLALVQWRIENASDPRRPLTWNSLPYEMIIVAAYPENVESEDD